ncbi:MAG: radical SAM protein [Magnetococcales bacterium]|nr:radical SAM protein [Magnetococcales bacterium]
MIDLRTMAGLGYQIVRSNVRKERQPVFLSLYITNRCNLKCSYCFVVDPRFSKEFLRMQLSLGEIKEIVDEFYAMGMRMIFMLGGEPLVHKEIGPIIEHIVNKGIYLQVVTNGQLIERRLESLRRVHGLCVSLDGLDEATDVIRGAGVYEKALQGIRVAVANRIPTRVHAVLTRNNLHHIRPLAELCRSLKVAMTISPPNFLGEAEQDYLNITSDEYRKFWKGYLDLYIEGLPIANSPLAIKKCMNWPKHYHHYIRRGEEFPGYKPTFCMNGYTYVAVGADATMYNCINLGPTHGPNIRTVGLRKAWEQLLDYRPDCVSCSSINCIETSLLLKLRLSAIWEGMRFHKGMVPNGS